MHRAHYLEYLPRRTVDGWCEVYLAAYLMILRAKTNRDGFPEQFAIERKPDMTPSWKGLTGAFAKLQHKLDVLAEPVHERLPDLEKRAETAVQKMSLVLDAGVEAPINDMEKFVADLEKTNGGPTLDGSKKPSEQG